MDATSSRAFRGDWTLLRRWIQRLAASVGAIELRPSPAPVEAEDAAWLEERRKDLARWEQALGAASFDLDGRLKALENAWEKVSGELDARLRGLQAAAEAGIGEPAVAAPVPPDAGDALLARMEAQAIEAAALWEELLRLDRRARVEKAWLLKTWIWLKEISLPALAAHLRGSPTEPRVAALRLRLGRLEACAAALVERDPLLSHEGLEKGLAASLARELKRLRAKARDHERRRFEAVRAVDAERREEMTAETWRLDNQLRRLKAELSTVKDERDRLSRAVEELGAEARRASAEARQDALRLEAAQARLMRDNLDLRFRLGEKDRAGGSTT
ncbi:MAG: hypothetical protein HY078_15855 [Elusimicrobia bacterium]|nr:hypothetical protein [Elusimicrobiota bacterium]